MKSEKVHGARTVAKRSEHKERDRERERRMPSNAISGRGGRQGRAMGQRTDGGFRGRHDFMKLVLARKAAAGVVLDAMVSYLL